MSFISKGLKRRIEKEYSLEKSKDEKEGQIIQALKTALEEDDIYFVLNLLKQGYVHCLNGYAKYIQQQGVNIKVFGDHSTQLSSIIECERVLKRKRMLYFKLVKKVQRFYKSISNIIIEF